MLKNPVRISTALFIAVLLTACASTPKLSNEQILERNERIAQLDKAVKDARAQGADYLAPDGYETVSRYLDQAIEEAASGRAEAARSSAQRGLNSLKKVNSDAEKSEDLLREVLAARERALEAGAAAVLPKDTSEQEIELRKTTSMVERGRLEDVKNRRPKLIAGYERLELLSLKEGMMDTAKAALEKARENGAKKYAPKTYNLASEELNLALSVLDADRTKTEKANTHASRAKWLAERSIVITELVKDFKRRDYTDEDIILWHQEQLGEIATPLGKDLPLNHDNLDVVIGLRDSIKELIRQRDETAIASSQYEQELSLTEDQKRSIAKIETMFSPNEANVYQQRKNVLVSAHGFRFPPGGSELEADNFSLLNKIIQAVRTFPNSMIRVSGHTDSTGSDALNLKLSEERAAKVARFLTEVGGIDAGRISVYGYGESRPIASNDTPEGRSANRRVEILIENP